MSARIDLNPGGLWPSLGFPMSHAVVEPAGRRVHLTGQVAWDENGDARHAGDVGAQAHMALDNVERVMAAAGGSLADVVFVNTYILHRDDWPIVAAVRSERFRGVVAPAFSTLLVAGLVDPALLVEFQCIAVVPDARLGG